MRDLFSRIKKFCSVTIICLLGFVLVALTGSAEGGTLRIMTFSDLHGAIRPSSDDVGGLARIASIIKDAKEEGKKSGFPVLAINMGDSVVYKSDYKTFERFHGKPEFGGMALCSLDLALPGNHDFDLGSELLEETLGGVSLDFICSNFISETSPVLDERFQSCRILSVGDYKVGFFGLLIKGYGSDLYASDNYAEIAEAMVRKLRGEGCSVVVAMSHLGYFLDQQLARNVDGIDVICGGHTHIVTEEPTVVEGIPIVHAGAYGEFVGELTFSLSESGVPEGLNWELISVDGDVPSDPEVMDFLAPYWEYYNEGDDPVFPATGSGAGCSSSVPMSGLLLVPLFLFLFGRRFGGKR